MNIQKIKFTKFIFFSPFEDDEDAGSLEEDSKGLTYMEQLNKYISKFKNLENISKDLFLEPVQHPCMEDYPPCSDEDIDHMEDFLTDQDMEPINEDSKKMQSVEEIKDNSLMEHEKPLWMEDLELEGEEVKLFVCDEDDYTSFCSLEETNYLKGEDIWYDLTSVCSRHPPLTIDNLSKDEIYEIIEPFNLILNNHMKRRSDQDGGFGYVVIEDILESI